MQSIIRLSGEKPQYTQDQLLTIFEELLHASFLFARSKDIGTFNLIIDQLLIPDFESRYMIPTWCDLCVRGTKFHDLAILCKMWLEVKSIATKNSIEILQFEKTTNLKVPDLGKVLMQDLINHTAMIMNKKYEASDIGGFIWHPNVLNKRRRHRRDS